MSLVTTLKELEGRIAELTGQLAAANTAAEALKVAHEQALAALRTGHAADLAAEQGQRAKDAEAHAAAIKELSDKLAEAKNKHEAAVAELASRDKRIEDLTASLEDLQTAHDSAQATITKLNERLAANPAFADAVAGRDQKPIPDGGGEATALETDEAFMKRYQAEPDARQRTIMWEAHMKATGRAP